MMSSSVRVGRARFDVTEVTVTAVGSQERS